MKKGLQRRVYYHPLKFMSKTVRTDRAKERPPPLRAARVRQARSPKTQRSTPVRRRGYNKGSKPAVLLRRPTPEQLYKTQLCIHFQRGACRYGAQCTFAHGASELKEFSYNRRPDRACEDEDKPASDATGCDTFTDGWNPPVMLGASITVPEEDWKWTEYIWTSEIRRFVYQNHQSSATAQAAPPATAQAAPPVTAQAAPPYAYPCHETRTGRLW